MEQTWFEMADVRRRRLSTSVWIPLRSSSILNLRGDPGFEGYSEEFFGAGSIAVPQSKRSEANSLTWDEVGLRNEQGSYSTTDRYKPADVYERRGESFGVNLTLVQHFNRLEMQQWHLNQDLVFALRLLRESDSWVRPDEDYCEVARLLRRNDGVPRLLEIKSEFLRDYLSARDMALLVSSYRSRTAIAADASSIKWPQGRSEQTNGAERFRTHVTEILEGGDLPGSIAVFHVQRTDLDPNEDVPELGPESPENTKSEHWVRQREGRKLYRIEGELWRNEWIEPAPHSPRVRGDKITLNFHYSIDASGTKASCESLNNEDVGKWLWFRPEVVPALINRRGGNLAWYTRDTGKVSCSPDYEVHFGLNQIGLVTVYAFDVAALPEWQQSIWSAFNVSPDGGVSSELLQSQVEARPAETQAPERALSPMLNALDHEFKVGSGLGLFVTHASTDELFSQIHRFRALGKDGLFVLAKDINRVITERIDIKALNKLVPPPRGEKWGSLKSLEKFLSKIVSPEDARKLMSPLFGVYELRMGDAHLPSKDMTETYAKVRIDRSRGPITQGFRLLVTTVSAIAQIAQVLMEANELSKKKTV